MERPKTTIRSGRLLARALLTAAAAVVLLMAPTCKAAAEAVKDGKALPALPEARFGDLTINGGGATNDLLVTSALIIGPILAVIIVLDLAIFGAFARSDEDLNPISNFFFHVRNGLEIVRRRHASSGWRRRTAPSWLPAEPPLASLTGQRPLASAAAKGASDLPRGFYRRRLLRRQQRSNERQECGGRTRVYICSCWR